MMNTPTPCEPVCSKEPHVTMQSTQAQIDNNLRDTYTMLAKIYENLTCRQNDTNVPEAPSCFMEEQGRLIALSMACMDLSSKNQRCLV